MRWIGKRNMIRTLFFLMLFLLAPQFSHLADPFVQIQDFVMCGLIIYWMISASRRLVKSDVSLCLKGIAIASVVLIVSKIYKYRLFDGHDDLTLLTWYFYIIPELLISTFSLMVGIGIDSSRSTIRKYLAGSLAIDLVLGLLFMTNSLHQLVYRFEMSNPDKFYVGGYTHGAIFWIAMVWIGLKILVTVILVIRKCTVSESRRYAWIPLLTSFVGLGIVCLTFIGETPMGFKTNDAFCFAIISFWECCMLIRLVPSCTDYDEIAKISSVAFSITDDDEQSVLLSDVADKVEKTEDMAFRSMKISGGTIRWYDDLSGVHHARIELDESIEKLKNESELIKEDKRVSKERQSLEIKNELYDDIGLAVKDQLMRISDIAERGKKEDLPRCAVYGVYIKRRANLMLLTKKDNLIPMAELMLTLKDATDYLALNGVSVSLVQGGAYSGEKKIAGLQMTDVFEGYEGYIERNLGSLKELKVEIAPEKNKILSLKGVLRDGKEAEVEYL